MLNQGKEYNIIIDLNIKPDSEQALNTLQVSQISNSLNVENTQVSPNVSVSRQIKSTNVINHQELNKTCDKYDDVEKNKESDDESEDESDDETDDSEDEKDEKIAKSTKANLETDKQINPNLVAYYAPLKGKIFTELKKSSSLKNLIKQAFLNKRKIKIQGQTNQYIISFSEPAEESESEFIFDGTAVSCTCPSFIHQTNKNGMCKHIDEIIRCL
jgi:hypothetical protein